MKELIINNKKYKVAVIGLGYVGLTYSLYLNSLGYEVSGIDINKSTLISLQNGNLPFFEENLEGYLKNSIDNDLLQLFHVDEYMKFKPKQNIIYIVTVGTPVFQEEINTKSLNNVFSFLKDKLNDEDAVVLRSTVPLGFTKRYCEMLSTKIFYCFAPERTIEGKAIIELSTLPQIFGCDHKIHGDFFDKIFRSFSSEVVKVENSKTAEMIKLTSNVYRDVIFGFSNEISLISYNNGINPKSVIDSCNYKYPRCNIYSSGPVAGPCLSKDSYILKQSINESITKSIILSSRRLNEKYVIDILSDLISKVKKSSILGVSFKGTPPTNDIRDSFAISLNNYLVDKNINVVGYDPLVYDEDFDSINLKRAYTLEEAFIDKDLIIIQNNNTIFKRMDIYKLSKLTNENAVILDLWSLHHNIKLYNRKYIAL